MKISPLIREKIKEQLLKLIEESRKDDYVKMPSERQLAQIFNVSRTTIRGVIKELIKEGLLEQFQGKGTYITPLREKYIHILTSPDLKSDDPFYTEFLIELTNILNYNAFDMSFVSLDKATRNLNNNIPLILIGLVSEEIIERLKNNYKFIISIEQYLNHDEIIQVSIDDYRVGWSAADILIKYKHNHLIHLSGPEKYTASYLRKAGFLERVKNEKNISFEIIEGKMNYISGYTLGEEVFKRLIGNKDKKIGVFAANDWMAIGLLQKLKERGVLIGKEISIIGCDDIPLAKEVIPNLTTFKWDIEKIIEEIVELLNDIFYGKNISNKRILISAKFVSRETLIN